jgi:hypothetical protein
MIIKGVPLAGQPRHVAIRPAWALGRVGAQVKPTEVQYGAWNFYQMPVYSNDDQELFWHMHIPGRWDGASNIIYKLFVALGGASAEDVGDKFKFQLTWDWAGPTHIASAGVAGTVPVEQDIITGRTAQYSVYELDFTIVWNADGNMLPGSILGGRIIRIASASPAIAASPLIMDHVLNFQIDRAYKA